MTQLRPTVKSIFDAALEISDAAERSAYLQVECGDDRDLRAKVDALLAAYANAESFLESPPPAFVATIAERTLTEAPGTVIGPYKLLQPIGEGGMGTVYLAEQTEPVERRVALKVIKPGMDSRQVIARFEAERQALALMDHPNIAKVLDAGTTEAGRPYFVMELVKGVPITRYCDEQHLTPRQRLELFVPVCQAVQHAHQKGIIHRDLKPSNVLIALYDGRPVPKVIDFGVAKATGHKLTDQTMFTELGQVVGTLEYMSPEQAEFNQLDIDTRSDIYSLGVLLYELLTGTTPFEKKRLKEAALVELLRIIREEEPQKPSTRLSTTAELASIAANRGLEPKRLSGLVRGDLDWIVMKALEKDRARRYETANGFASDVLRYLADEPVTACPPSARYKLRKFVRRNRTGVAVAGVLLLSLVIVAGGIGYTLTERAARRARLAAHVELILQEVARLEQEQKWPEALAAARWADSAKAGGEIDASLQLRVQQALSDLELVRRLEGIRMRSGSTDVDHAQVDRLYQRSFQDVGVRVDSANASLAVKKLQVHSAIQSALGPALDDWATARFHHGDSPGTEALRELASAIDPDPWRRPLREAWAHDEWDKWERLATSPDLTRQPPATLLLLGVTLCEIGKLDRGIEVLRGAARRYPGDFWINFELGLFLPETGSAHLDEALAFRRAALAVRPTDSGAWNNVAGILIDKGMFDDAIECCRRAIELQPANAVACDNLGVALQNKGQLDEAIVWHRKAIELDPEWPNAYYNLGAALELMEDLEGAMAAYRQALAVEPRSVLPHVALGNCLQDRGDFDGAIISYRQAIALQPDHAMAHGLLGVAFQRLQQFEEAIESYRLAIEHDPLNYRHHNFLGTCLVKAGRMDEAVAASRKALELNPSSETYAQLGSALMRNHQTIESLACCRRAVELDPRNPNAHNALGNILAWTGQRDDAIVSYRMALDLEPDAENEAVYFANLANALQWNGQMEEALETRRKLHELQPDNAEWCSEYARLLVSSDGGHRDPVRAIQLARHAVELAPQQGDSWNTLGVAEYRGGDWQGCIDALHQSIELRRGGDCIDRYFLGMAHWQLGDHEQALQWYDRAIEWLEKNTIETWYQDEELKLFRREACTLLGLQDSIRLDGHIDEVRAVAVSQDGRLALSGGMDRSLRLWDVAAGKELGVWTGHGGAVFSLAFSSDGRTAVSGSWDGTMRSWDVATGTELRRFEHGQMVWAVAMAPGDKRAISACADNAMRLWDLDSGLEITRFEGHTDAIRSVAFSPDGTRILSGSQDLTVRLWDAATGKELRHFDGHTALVLSVALSPDGRRVVSGGSDAIVRLWDVDTGEQLGAFEGHQGNIEVVSFTPDGRRALSGGVDGTIRLWSLPEGRELHRIETVEVLGLAISPDGRQLLVANADSGVRMWKLPGAPEVTDTTDNATR